jgi:hypothetical protein
VPETPESLRREVERLREQLVKAREERDEYRQAAYALLDKVMPYTPPRRKNCTTCCTARGGSL